MVQSGRRTNGQPGNPVLPAEEECVKQQRLNTLKMDDPASSSTDVVALPDSAADRVDSKCAAAVKGVEKWRPFDTAASESIRSKHLMLPSGMLRGGPLLSAIECWMIPLDYLTIDYLILDDSLGVPYYRLINI